MPRSRRDSRQGELFTAPVDGAGPRQLEHEALLRLLEQGGCAGVTVVTPNQRLAQSLIAEVDALHLAQRRSHWEAPDVLSIEHFFRRCHDELVYSPAGADVPSLLSEPAAALLWEEAIRASRWRDMLLSIPATAALAAEAWALANAWRIAGALRSEPGSDDAEAFASWAEHYEKRTRRDGLTEMARLPGVIAPLLAEPGFPRPQTLVMYAFDLVTPQQGDFLEACERAGIVVARSRPPRLAAAVQRVMAETPRAELELAAAWARSRLEEAHGRPVRIGVVIPDLAQRRREATRVFSRVFAPAGMVPGEAPPAFFNVSLGEPLAAYPIVDAALALIELACGPVPYDVASRILRSPFIAAAESEMAERARLDAALRRAVPASISLSRLCQLASETTKNGRAPRCAGMTRLLDKMLEASRERDRAPPYDWARRFTRILDAAGFPGERTLDSAEFQALEKWRETLGGFAALGALASNWSDGEARARLRRFCADTVFQPRSGSAPVQVLGLLESAGLEFEHLWVSGLTEEAWPIASRPHPLIAPALQRRAGIPQASPEKALEFDQRITAGWKGAAGEVVFSCARADGDRELLASPFIADLQAADPAALRIRSYASRATLLAERRATVQVSEDAAPKLAGALAKGGTGILVDQAACPFRAFAHYRLDARALETPGPGLEAKDRGTLLHALMAKIWEALKDHATLVATDGPALEALIADATAHAIKSLREQRPGRLEGRFAELEAERLAQIAREWLEIERARPPFEVHMREEKLKLQAGSVEIEGRIDRMDRLADGGIAVIDYKTGVVAVGDWMGERPADAQLPLYALAATQGDQVRAVAFARLKTGDRGFTGVARDEKALPGLTVVGGRRYAASWEELEAKWRNFVGALGEGFASGDAKVDPKEMLATCRRCDLKPLCRVHERLSPLDLGDEIVDGLDDKEEGE